MSIFKILVLSIAAIYLLVKLIKTDKRLKFASKYFVYWAVCYILLTIITTAISGDAAKSFTENLPFGFALKYWLLCIASMILLTLSRVIDDREQIGTFTLDRIIFALPFLFAAVFMLIYVGLSIWAYLFAAVVGYQLWKPFYRWVKRTEFSAYCRTTSFEFETGITEGYYK